MSNNNKIAFQGTRAAYSDLACRQAFPEMETLPCPSFRHAFIAVQNGDAKLAMIPIDNTIAGRVADVHYLLARATLFITGEHFQTIEHCLLAPQGSKINNLQHIHSHVHALPQCRKLIDSLNLTPHVSADTASAAAYVAKLKDKTHAAISSELAAEVYGLEILKHNIQDESTNTTRFLILSSTTNTPPFNENAPVITSLLFQVRNIPAALYKSLGGFASNGLSLAKLESYVDEKFQAAKFYCDVEGHPEDPAFKNAIEELNFFAKNIQIIGTYRAHPFRRTTPR